MSNQRNFRIGLTGGIASGKSIVAEMFADLGIPVIDTDVIAREVVAPGTAAIGEIREAFGADVITADGRLDRNTMRSIVFADDAARRKLEGILHPRIRAATIDQAATAGGDYQMIVVPLLVESPLRSFVDRILVVDCSEGTQVERLLRRDAESEDQARRMIAAQASREERLAVADDVVRNEGDLRDTRRQVQELHETYLETARAR
jgi:dephospho-CoA kinase